MTEADRSSGSSLSRCQRLPRLTCTSCSSRAWVCCAARPACDFILRSVSYFVTAMVRSQDEARQLQELNASSADSRLDFIFVPDTCAQDAFLVTMEHDPPFDAVVHTASAFTSNVRSAQKVMLALTFTGRSCLQATGVARPCNPMHDRSTEYCQGQGNDREAHRMVFMPNMLFVTMLMACLTDRHFISLRVEQYSTKIMGYTSLYRAGTCCGPHGKRICPN